MTKDRISEIRARLQAATPGPLFASGYPIQAHHGFEFEVSSEGGTGIWVANCQRAHDAELFAHAPDDIAFLLEQLEWSASVQKGLMELQEEWCSERKRLLSELDAMRIVVEAAEQVIYELEDPQFALDDLEAVILARRAGERDSDG